MLSDRSRAARRPWPSSRRGPPPASWSAGSAAASDNGSYVNLSTVGSERRNLDRSSTTTCRASGLASSDRSQSGRACAEPSSRPRAPRSGGGAERRVTTVSTRRSCGLDDAPATTTSWGRRESRIGRFLAVANTLRPLALEAAFPAAPAAAIPGSRSSRDGQRVDGRAMHRPRRRGSRTAPIRSRAGRCAPSACRPPDRGHQTTRPPAACTASRKIERIKSRSLEDSRVGTSVGTGATSW